MRSKWFIRSVTTVMIALFCEGLVLGQDTGDGTPDSNMTDPKPGEKDAKEVAAADLVGYDALRATEDSAVPEGTVERVYIKEAASGTTEAKIKVKGARKDGLARTLTCATPDKVKIDGNPFNSSIPVPAPSSADHYYTLTKMGSWAPSDTVVVTLDVDGQQDTVTLVEMKVEIEKCPATFEPKGGAAPAGGAAPSQVQIKAKVTPNTILGRFKFLLPDAAVSTEPGYCMNAPITSPSEDKDLQFPNQTGFSVSTVSAGADQTAETTADNLYEATVLVDCFDYGAYGRIKVEFTKQGTTTPITGKEESGTKEYTNIPLDDNDNHISDGAEQNTGPGATKDEADDNDNDPIDITATGDGITRYEEYRGFIIVDTAPDGSSLAVHTRTSVTNRDLFIYDPEPMGFGFYPTASGVVCHRIANSQWTGEGKRSDSKRIVDPNRKSWKDPVPAQSGHSEVCGIHLKMSTLGAGIYGECRDDPSDTVGNGAGTPSRFLTVLINPGACAGNPPLLKAVIAHEIAHSTLVQHHDTSHRPDRQTLLPHYWGDKRCVMRYISDPISSYETGGIIETGGITSWWVKELCVSPSAVFSPASHAGCKNDIDVRSHKVVP